MFGKCDHFRFGNATRELKLTMEEIHDKCFEMLITLYAGALVTGVFLTLIVGYICYRRRRLRGKKDLYKTMKRKNKGRQKVQLLFSRRLSFENVADSGNNFMIRYSILQSSDWDSDARIKTEIPPFPPINDGLLIQSGSVVQLPENKPEVEHVEVPTNDESLSATNVRAEVENGRQWDKVIEEASKVTRVKAEVENDRRDRKTEVNVFVSEQGSDGSIYANTNCVLTDTVTTDHGSSPLPERNYDKPKRHLEKCLTIANGSDTGLSRFHSLVEFIPNSPDGIKIDGQIWKKKSKE